MMMRGSLNHKLLYNTLIKMYHDELLSKSYKLYDFYCSFHMYKNPMHGAKMVHVNIESTLLSSQYLSIFQ